MTHPKSIGIAELHHVTSPVTDIALWLPYNNNSLSGVIPWIAPIVSGIGSGST